MFLIDTIADCVTRARAAIATNLPGADAALPINNLGPLAKIIGGEVWQLFGRLAEVARQARPITAGGDDLESHAEQYGLARRPAAPATGSVTINVTNTASLAIGATFERLDGQRYIALAGAARIGAGDMDVTVQALTQSALSNAGAGVSLAIVSGLTGAGASGASAAVGADGVAGGADLEDDEALRARLLFRLRYPPHAGTVADYVRWCMESAGVTRVFVDRLWQGPGTVRIFPLFDDLRPGGVPTSSDVTILAAALAAVQPAGAGVTIVAAVPQAIDVVIGGLDLATDEVKANIRLALGDVIRARGQVAGTDNGAGALDFLATPFVFSRSWIAEAISGAYGERRHVLTTPAADVAIAEGAVPTLGVVTFT